MRSLREREPVLICPAEIPTAKSAITVSSVSPERCEITTPNFASFGHHNGFDRFGDGADLVQFYEDRIGEFLFNAFFEAFLVGDEEVVSDDLDLVSMSAVILAKPSKSSSASPSSMEMIGYSFTNS